MLRDIELKAAERQALKSLTRAVMIRLLPQSPEFQGTLNRGENRMIRVLALLPGLLAAILCYVLVDLGGDRLAESTGLGVIADDRAPLVSAAVALLLLSIFNPLAQWLDEHLMELWSTFFLFRHKWPQGKVAASLLAATENIIRTRPDKVILATGQVAERGADPILPQAVRRALEDFPGPNGPRLIILRQFMERRLKGDYVRDGLRSPVWDETLYENKYFLRARSVRNAIRTQILFNELGAVLRAEIPSQETWQRFYHSDPTAQETTLFDSHDLHQRFRTAAPHYRWPVSTATDPVGETATFRIVAAIENPMRQPIYAITVAGIIDRFPEVVRDFFAEEQDAIPSEAQVAERVEAYLQALRTVDVQMFGKYDPITLRPRSSIFVTPQPVLRNLAGDGAPADWALRYDPNRVVWEGFDESDGNIRRAFAVLAEAIQREGDAADPIVLTRGDAMLIDNQRCLIARREPNTATQPPLKRRLLYPNSWWLRGYYGFREPRSRSLLSPSPGNAAPPPPEMTDAPVPMDGAVRDEGPPTQAVPRAPGALHFSPPPPPNGCRRASPRASRSARSRARPRSAGRSRRRDGGVIGSGPRGSV
ncbi:ATP synthase subunit D [Parvularcula bermudensis HTCC2503]|uniref:ATP synthase subunit D n=1 Tax=Parvularcula bermudensis (strain ATCC BAA-594 / HTCC2503 / KCTC 12087) TaxID=314260 RepID=E0TFU4_PARBH|nr:hypothetical protein [Parvularcula bermudensis]ADM09109.1 ATP synthase subunit D [Parvularcula bermudensis HTCC2503]